MTDIYGSLDASARVADKVRGIEMNTTRQQLKDLVDAVDESSLDEVYAFILRFIPDEPTPDELAGIERGRAEFARGEFFREDEIDWESEPTPEQIAVGERIARGEYVD
jgi:predicted transcriptional regulator